MSSSANNAERRLARDLQRYGFSEGGGILRPSPAEPMLDFIVAWGTGSNPLGPVYRPPTSDLAWRAVTSRRALGFIEARSIGLKSTGRVTSPLRGEARRVLALPFARQEGGSLEMRVLKLVTPSRSLDLRQVSDLMRQWGCHPVGWGDTAGVPQAR